MHAAWVLLPSDPNSRCLETAAGEQPSEYLNVHFQRRAWDSTEAKQANQGGVWGCQPPSSAIPVYPLFLVLQVYCNEKVVV